MSPNISEFLALVNDVLQANIVIFGAAVVLYNTGRTFRDPVVRAFSTLISFFIIVYLTELLVSRTIISVSTELWLRLEWVGISMVPAAQFSLSSALLTTTGAAPERRKPLGALIVGAGLTFTALAIWTELLVVEVIRLPLAPHLSAGPLFSVFTAYFWLVTTASIYNVWRARQRCFTTTTRRRMSTALATFVAVPIGVFPYLAISADANVSLPILFWPVLIGGNLIVGVMFGLLTSQLIYFGSVSPDRVVRVRLYKFMARVPLAGSIVLLVFVLVSRSSPILGLPTETALGFTLVATVMLVEWLVHRFKRPLERLFQLNDEPDIRRIQHLSERLLTTSNLRQYLESVLAATCERLRTPTAFVAAITADGAKLESVVGPLGTPDDLLDDADLSTLTRSEGAGDDPENLLMQDEFIIWNEFWIKPLYNQKGNVIIGIFGVRARSSSPDFSENEQNLFRQLTEQAAQALEDRILQQEVFKAVEGLLPEITAFQQRLSAATSSGMPLLNEPGSGDTLVNDPEFNVMVRDALTHYWGGPKLTKSPLMRLEIVQRAVEEHGSNPANALRHILTEAIELQKPEGQRSMTTAEWILYNILELKFVRGQRVRDVARRLAMSESDLYRKQRVAIENVARSVTQMEVLAHGAAAPEPLSALAEEAPPE